MNNSEWKTYRDVPCAKILREKVKRMTPLPEANYCYQEYSYGISYEALKSFIESRNFDNPIIAIHFYNDHETYIEGLCIVHETWETDDEFSNRRISYQKNIFKQAELKLKKIAAQSLQLEKERKEYERLKRKFEK